MERFPIDRTSRALLAVLRFLRMAVDLDFVRSSFPLGRRKMARSRKPSKSKSVERASEKKQPLANALQDAPRGGKPRLVVSRRRAGPARRSAGPARSTEPIALANILADIDDEDESPYERPLVPMVREVKAPCRSRGD